MDKVKPDAAGPPTIPDVDNTDLTGRTLGDFQIIRRLGKGGMGQVFLAEQLSLQRKVALKFLRADLASNPTAMERFRAEAKAVAKATHANIVQVYAVDQIDGLQYMVLEYVEGRTLREFVDKKGPPDLVLALSIMRQGASALLRAAELGIVHRDIKPDNILLTRKGEVKVADFGLARVLDSEGPGLNLTQSGVVMGTPLYMSPEQVEGKALDARSDIYSFGVTCYHMLTGHPPFRGASAIEVALQHLHKEPPPLATIRSDLPEAFHAIINKMMAKDPGQRYQTSRDLLRDIVRLRESLSTTTQATPQLGADVSVSVELMPVEAGAVSSHSLPLNAAFTVAWWKRNWLPLAVAGSLLLALGLGALMARGRKTGAAAAPVVGDATREGQPAADVKQVEAILGKKRREEGLLAALDPFLEPETVANPQKLRAGFELAMELSVFYLDEHKLEEAKPFFGRLEKITQVRQYNHLGRIGRAIVLGLQSKARESNALFRDIAGTIPFRGLNAKKADKMENKKNAAVDLVLGMNTRFHFWIAEALHYNQRNGIRDEDVPEVFLRIRRKAEEGSGR